MKVHDCEQGTEAWHEIRLGRVTASHFKDVLNKKSGRETYMERLATERRFGERQDVYQNKAMAEGTAKEPDARDWYACTQWVDVEQVGFVEKTDDVGCSPDGLVGTDGMIEIKCPYLSTHNRYERKYFKRGILVPEYKAQVQGQLWVCERQWCDFISYHPDAVTVDGEDVRLLVVRVERDEAYLTILSAAVATFVTELKEMEN